MIGFLNVLKNFIILFSDVNSKILFNSFYVRNIMDMLKK